MSFFIVPICIIIGAFSLADFISGYFSIFAGCLFCIFIGCTIRHFLCSHEYSDKNRDLVNENGSFMADFIWSSLFSISICIIGLYIISGYSVPHFNFNITMTLLSISFFLIYFGYFYVFSSEVRFKFESKKSDIEDKERKNNMEKEKKLPSADVILSFMQNSNDILKKIEENNSHLSSDLTKALKKLNEIQENNPNKIRLNKD